MCVRPLLITITLGTKGGEGKGTYICVLCVLSTTACTTVPALSIRTRARSTF